MSNYKELPLDNEFIDIYSFDNLCKKKYAAYHGGPDIPDSPITFMHSHWVRDFYQKRNSKKSIIISGAADTSIIPPERIGSLLTVGINGRTYFTMDSLPANIIKWYTVNLGIDDPRLEWLPFGLNSDTEPLSPLRNIEKKYLLYVNFQNHTIERIQLKQSCTNVPWVTLRIQANLPGEEFRKEVAQSKFVLCTHGIGLDCYRTYEALYAGSYPVMIRNTFSKKFKDLPVLLIDSYQELTQEFLERKYHEFRQREFDYSRLYLSYWEDEFSKAESLFGGVN